MRDWKFLNYHPLSMTIHSPILPKEKTPENIKELMDESYKSVMSGLVPEYQGFIENPDQ